MGIEETALYLSGCALNGKIPDKSRLEGVNFEELYGFASAHMISALLGYALESAGINNKKFSQARARAERKSVVFENDCRMISERLESSGIWHMLIKGSVMRNYYPAFGLREMSDVDILFDSSRSDDVREIMKGLGFESQTSESAHHDVYYKPPLSIAEMHRELFGSWQTPEICRYYDDVKRLMLLDEGKNYTYHFSAEDFYIHITAHSYHHYITAGTGLRSVLDEYVYLKKFSDSMNWEYISQESLKLGIKDFEEQLRSLSLKVIDGGELSEKESAMLKYIVNSGVHGSGGNVAENEMMTLYGGSRVRFMLASIFPPFKKLKYTAPFVYRHKYLYPFYLIGRLISGVITRPGRVISRLRSIFSRSK